MRSVQRPFQDFTEPKSQTARRKLNGSGSASVTRPPGGAVPSWPQISEDTEGDLTVKPGHPAATPTPTASASVKETPYGTSSVVQHHYDNIPMYASTSRLHPTPKPMVIASVMSNEDYRVPSVAREGSTSRTFADDPLALTASRLLKGVNESQEVVLFALHPQTIIRPLRKAIRHVFSGLLEWLLEVMHRRGMPRNIALARLNRTRWFAGLFDYVAVERMLNIFKIYLSQSDALAVPRDFVDVYDAFSPEINRYCLSESVRTNMIEHRNNRAFVVGGIDFTEETLKSMTRSVDLWGTQSNQTPHLQSQLLMNISGSTANTAASSPGILTDPLRSPAIANSTAALNRGYFLNKDNLMIMNNLVTRLQSVLRHKEKELEKLQRERRELDLQLSERKKVLLEICSNLTNQRIISDSMDFHKTLAATQQQFDAVKNPSGTSKAMEEIKMHMRSINKAASVLSRM